MIRVKVIKDFNLAKFNELKNITRANLNKNQDGSLYENDTFECTNEMAKYLMGGNPIKGTFVEVIEIVPEENKEVEDTKKKTTTRRRKKSVAKD